MPENPRASAPGQQHEDCLDAATDAVMRDYALFRDPRYGTELVRSEVRDIVALAVKTYIEVEAVDV